MLGCKNIRCELAVLWLESWSAWIIAWPGGVWWADGAAKSDLRSSLGNLVGWLEQQAHPWVPRKVRGSDNLLLPVWQLQRPFSRKGMCLTCRGKQGMHQDWCKRQLTSEQCSPGLRFQTCWTHMQSHSFVKLSPEIFGITLFFRMSVAISAPPPRLWLQLPFFPFGSFFSKRAGTFVLQKAKRDWWRVILVYSPFDLCFQFEHSNMLEVSACFSPTFCKNNIAKNCAQGVVWQFFCQESANGKALWKKDDGEVWIYANKLLEAAVVCNKTQTLLFLHDFHGFIVNLPSFQQTRKSATLHKRASWFVEKFSGKLGNTSQPVDEETRPQRPLYNSDFGRENDCLQYLHVFVVERLVYCMLNSTEAIPTYRQETLSTTPFSKILNIGAEAGSLVCWWCGI